VLWICPSKGFYLAIASVPEPLTKADKAALKRDNARAKAEIEINKAKIEEAN
jgi:hypothetical protein